MDKKIVNIKEQTLQDALAEAGLKELPKRSDGQGDWNEAIVLIRRSAFYIQSYALAKKVNGELLITHDFGASYSMTSLGASDDNPSGIIAYFPICKAEDEPDNTPEENESDWINGLDVEKDTDSVFQPKQRDIIRKKPVKNKRIKN